MDANTVFPISEPPLVHPPTFGDFASIPNGTALVIDNVLFDNVFSKYKDRKSGATMLLVGADAYSDAAGRSNVRSAFESDVVVNSENMEHILDFVLQKLGVDGSLGETPFVITEPPCHPTHSRSIISELVFEGYSPKSLCFAVDSLCSYYYSSNSETSQNSGLDTGIVISSGNHSTHVLPIYDARADFSNAKRISYGGSQATSFLMSLVGLKYPTLPSKLTHGQALHLLQNHMNTSIAYKETLRKFANHATIPEETHIIQMPFTIPAGPDYEKIAAQESRRAENIAKLKDAAAKIRTEKLKEKESILYELVEIRDIKGLHGEDAFLAELDEQGFQDEATFEESIRDFERTVLRMRAKEAGIELPEEEREAPVIDEVLIATLDAELTPDMLHEKRRQKSIKAGWEYREKMRREKDLEKFAAEEALRKEEQWRQNDFKGWISHIHQRLTDVIERLRRTRKMKLELSDRRSTASKDRARRVTSLVNEEGKDRRRKRVVEGDDGFGMEDEDWGVYKVKGEDEQEEIDTAELEKLNAVLVQHDPSFEPEVDIFTTTPFSNTIISQLAYGPTGLDANNLEMSNQIHLNVERYRVPEVLFEPTSVGIDQAGIVETIGYILRNYSSSVASEMCKNIYVTGTHTLYPNFLARLQSEITSIRPANSTVTIRAAQDPRLDAWRGAALFARSSRDFESVSVTRSEWLECGSDYFKECIVGNRFHKSS